MSNQEIIESIDSDVGGLTVLKEALEQLPDERLIYLGDTARCPYGPRPTKQVVQFTWEMANFLLKKRVKMLVIACNIATIVALEGIETALPTPVVGVTLPGARVVVKVTKNNKISVIDTSGTIKSASYEIVIRSRVSTIEMTGLAYPKFVSIVESNQYRSSVTKGVMVETLQALQLEGLDTLILGCTHYPLLRLVIQNVMGSRVALVDSGAETVSEVNMLLDYFDTAHAPETPIQPYEFYAAGSAKTPEEIANSRLDIENLKAQQIHLGGNKNDWI